MARLGSADGQGSAEKLGYLGLGMMGSPMTRRLLERRLTTSPSGTARPARPPRWSRPARRLAADPRDVAARSQHHLHVPHRRGCRGRRGVRSRRPCDRGRRRKTRRRLLVDPPGCRARHRDAAEGGERHGMDRCAGLGWHQGRRGRHACGDGRRRRGRYRAGAALRSGDGAAVHPYGSDRRRPDHQALQSGHRRLRHGGARGSDAARRERRNRRRAATGSPRRRLSQIPFPCNCSCRAWCRAFIRRRLAISQRC